MVEQREVAGLLARINAATGPDRELDAAIMFDLFAQRVPGTDAGTIGYVWPSDHPSWSFAVGFPGKDKAWLTKHGRGEQLLIEREGVLTLVNSRRVPKLTASIDAALALVERRLPGIWWVLAKGRLSEAEPLSGCELLFGSDEQLAIAAGHSPALAILAALLKAVEARSLPIEEEGK